MPPTTPVLLHALDANGNIHPVRSGSNGLNVNLTDYAAVEQHFTCGTVSESGENIVLAAPGNCKQNVIAKLQVQAEEADAVSVIIRAGYTELWRTYFAAVGSGLLLDFAVPDRMHLGNDLPLIIYLDSAVKCNYSIQWYTVATACVDPV